MNEVAGGLECPQCDTTNSSIAAYCSGCGAALAQPIGRQPAPYAGTAALPQPFQQPPVGLVPYGQPGVQPAYRPPQGYAASYAPPPVYGTPYQQQPLPGHYPQPYPGEQGQYAQSPAPYAPPYPGYQAPINVSVNPVINVQTPITMQGTGPMQPPIQPIVVLNTEQAGPNLVVRGLWFLFVGLWAGLIATVLGWALCAAVITLPLGLLLLNRLPAIMTLRPPSRTTQVWYGNGVTMINTNVAAIQLPFMLRALYFLLIGWWFSALWLTLAWIFVVFSVVTLGLTLPAAFIMFDRVPQVLTLRVN